MIVHCFVLFYCHYSFNSYFPSGYFYVFIVCISSLAKCFFLSLAIFSLYYMARSPKICGRQTGDTGEPTSSLGLSPKAWQVGESMLLTPIRKFAGSSPKKGQYFNLSSKEGKDGCSSSTVKQKFPLTQPFCSIKIFSWLDRPTQTKESNLLYSISPFKCWSQPETPRIMLGQTHVHSRWYNINHSSYVAYLFILLTGSFIEHNF